MPKKSKSKKNKSKAKKSQKSKKARVEPIPKGFRTVTPYLSLNRAAEALDWYKKAFGAKELLREAAPDGKIFHARVRIGDSTVMLSDNFQQSPETESSASGPSRVTLHIYSKNADKFWQQAIDNGAKVEMPIDNQYWGERYGKLSDPYGHSWSVSQQVQMTAQEKKEKQEQAMAMFSQGQHPAGNEQGSETGSVASISQD